MVWIKVTINHNNNMCDCLRCCCSCKLPELLVEFILYSVVRHTAGRRS